jgi:hypothetical protein
MEGAVTPGRLMRSRVPTCRLRDTFQSLSTIRFHGVRELTALLAAAGLEVIEQFGDWDRDRPVTGSLEVVTVARRARLHAEPAG